MLARNEFKRVKRIRSYTGYARFLATVTDGGWIENQPEIPSPYAYSPAWLVYIDNKGRRVFVRETSHRCYDVFEIPAALTVYPSSEMAENAFILRRCGPEENE